MFFLNGALGSGVRVKNSPRLIKALRLFFKNHFFQDAPFFYKKIRSIGFLMRMW